MLWIWVRGMREMITREMGIMGMREIWTRTVRM
jgi:hypothetical protein